MISGQVSMQGSKASIAESDTSDGKGGGLGGQTQGVRKLALGRTSSTASSRRQSPQVHVSRASCFE
jgi:hypothetical protein